MFTFYLSLVMVDLLSSSSVDVEYLLVCDKDDTQYLSTINIDTLLYTASKRGSDRYLNMDIFCNENFIFNNLEPDTNYTLIMTFGSVEECNITTTFRTMAKIG